MKKLMLFAALASVILLNFSSSQPAGNTGAPGDSFCGNCHNGTSAITGNVEISGLPSTITPNTLYSITVTVNNTSNNAARAGFQLLALNQSNNNTGTFSGIPSNTSVITQSGRTYWGHAPAVNFNGSSSLSWTTNWTSPVAGQASWVAFYASTVLGNANGNNNGDRSAMTNVTATMAGGGTPLTVNVTLNNNATCSNSSNGRATAMPSGGSMPYSYSWDNGETTPQAQSLNAGLHRVTVTDMQNNQTEGSITINAPSPLLSNATNVNDETCFQAFNGSATISGFGGTPPYSYNWLTGADVATRNNLTSGTYNITVSDANACTNIQQVFIDGPDVPFSLTSSIINAACADQLNGSISLTALNGSPPYTASWSDNTSGLSRSNLGPGVYAVTVTDQNSCTATGSYQVNAPSPINVVSQNIFPACNNQPTGGATLLATGGVAPFVYSWSDGGTGRIRNDLNGGNYTVIITDNNNCTKTLNLSIPNSPVINIDSISSTQPSCSGVNNGSLTVEAGGGSGSNYLFLWSNNATGRTVTGIGTGPISVVVTDGNGCTNMRTFQVSGAQSAALSLLSTSATTCAGDSNGSATLSIVNGAGYTINWSNGGTGLSQNNLTAGTYQITGVNSAGCTTNPITVVVNAPDPLLATPDTIVNLRCHNDNSGAAQITISGGTGAYNVLWSNGASGASIGNLQANNYQALISDANGCLDTLDITITQPSPLSNDSTRILDATCPSGNNGMILPTYMGGTAPYNFAWSNGDSAQILDMLSAGTYSLIVEDTNGCIDSQMYVVNQPNPFNFGISVVNESVLGANDGMITSNVSGGTPPYNYLWSNGSKTSALEQLAAGRYGLTVTDANGCSSSRSANVSSGACALNANAAVSQVSCAGGSDGAIILSIFNNLGNVTISVNDSIGSLTGLSAGIYGVLVTDTAGCTVYIDSVVITEPAPIAVTTDSIKSDLEGNGIGDGAILISVIGGIAPYTYNWKDSTGSEISATRDLTNVTSGTYSVIVTDNNGCTTESSITIGSTVPNSSNDIASAKVNVYPNPINQKLYLDIGSGVDEVTIFNNLGQIVSKFEVKPGITTLEVGQWEQGLFYLHTHNGVKGSWIKIIKQ